MTPAADIPAGPQILLGFGETVYLNCFACPVQGACVSLAGIKLGVRVVIDPDGFRPNVGIVLMRTDGKLFWARRVNRDGWQFPQGGMNTDETPLEAMYRELYEEVGLSPEHVEVLGVTPGWLRYRLPNRCIRRGNKPLCIGQKQVWFLLRFNGNEADVSLNLTEKPEFDSWRWVDFWYPVEHVVYFKREVYVRALQHLSENARTLAGEEAIPKEVCELVQQFLVNGSKSKSGKR